MTKPETAKGGGSPPSKPSLLRVADRFLDGFEQIARACAELLLAAMLLINIINVLSRNLGGPSLLWVWPWTSTMMVWSVFLAFYVMYRRNVDISMGVLVDRFSPFWKKMANLLAQVCGFCVVGLLTLEASQIVHRQAGVIELVGLPRYALSLPLIISSAMLMVHFLSEIVSTLMGYETIEPPQDDEALIW